MEIIPDGRGKVKGKGEISRENARRVFELSEVERDIIRKHLFPLTPVPPRYREGWLVVLADKVCSVYEFFRKDAYRGIKIRYFSH